jgi:hypothetical protein
MNRLVGPSCLALLVLSAGPPCAGDEPPKKAETVEIKAPPELYLDYGGNVIAADKKYLDKTVVFGNFLPGKVKKEGDKYYLGIQTLANQADNDGIICELSAEGAKQYADYKPGAKWKLQGVCKGRRETKRVFTGYEVIMKDCSFITEEKK